MEQNIFQRAVFFFFLTLFCISIFLVGKVIAPFFASLLLGIVITGIFRPVFRGLDRFMPARMASVLTCLAVFFIVFIPVVYFVGILSREALGLYNLGKDAMFSNNLINFLESTRALERINEFLTRANIQIQISWRELVDPLTEVGKNLGFSLFQQARFLTSNLLNLVFYFCLMLIVVFYMFMDGERFMQYIYDLSPLKDEHNRKLFEKFNDMAGAVLIGNGLGGLIQGVAGGLLFWVLGLNSPLLWGVVMGFLAFLPIVGIGVVMLPAALFFLLKGSLGKCIFIVGFYTVLSWGIEYIFKPKVVGDRVAMHPLIVFFAIIGGLKVYGILGIIYGPLIATLFLTLSDIYFSTFQSMVEPGKGMLDSWTDQ
ncbi:AI-2E family transporter [Desulfobacter vibrioformis]|uniref:AI-2E family transporter n=1 Tax=Desulfobacter vibrioformis TaxID=34031 RepID=UPI00055577C5|nr:AI-2E family transporter [Desulfobacter vibrioformis]